MEELNKKEMMTDGLPARYDSAVIAPLNTNTSSLPAGLKIYPMNSFEFEGDELVWTKKKVAKAPEAAVKKDCLNYHFFLPLASHRTLNILFGCIWYEKSGLSRPINYGSLLYRISLPFSDFKDLKNRAGDRNHGPVLIQPIAGFRFPWCRTRQGGRVSL